MNLKDVNFEDIKQPLDGRDKLIRIIVFIIIFILSFSICINFYRDILINFSNFSLIISAICVIPIMWAIGVSYE